MPTMRPDPMSIIDAAVNRWLGQVGRGLIGLACSGGADSMTLVDAVHRLAGASALVVLHIDHGLHVESARIARELGAWAAGQGLAYVSRRVLVEPAASIEAAAREQRYRALDALADELGVSAIGLAHTARDQAETVLMRVVRGTGPAGLAGIPAVRGRYARPLLAIGRDVIDGHVAARTLPVWDDPMNRDEALTRVRFRRRHLPALRAENPALDEALVRLADTAREWRDALEAIAAPLARLPLDCVVLRAQPAAVRKLAYSIALGGRGYDADHLEAIDELVCRPAAGERRLDLPGVTLVRQYEQVVRAEDPRPTSVQDAPPVPAGFALRVWRSGDRMRPVRLRGRSRKLGDLFIDLKVPRSRRGSARVVARLGDDEIVWTEHVGPAVDCPEDVEAFCGLLTLQAGGKGPC